MLIYKICDSIVFNALKNIKHGFLKIKKTTGEVLEFGNPEDHLNVSLDYLLKINPVVDQWCFCLPDFTSTRKSNNHHSPSYCYYFLPRHGTRAR